MRYLGSAICAAALLAGGCAPIPLIPYAPSASELIEAPQAPLVQTALAGGSSETRAVLAVRSGRALRTLELERAAESALKLPSSRLRGTLSEEHITPYRYAHLKSGDAHYYNFTVTPQYAEILRLYLLGEGEAALAAADEILKRASDVPNLLWQASHMRVLILLMMGRPDLAELETQRTEALERKAMGGNHWGRSLRAEVRYWAGDLAGAAADAAEVARAFGDWRFPTVFNTPPIDQVQLCRLVNAQVRAHTILGLTMVARGNFKAALEWLELANQTMNNIMYAARHPVYGLFFRPSEEIYLGRGFVLAALATAHLALEPDSAVAQARYTQALGYFDAVGYRVGPLLVETFKAHAFSVAGRHERAELQAAAAGGLARQAGALDYVWRLEALRGQSLVALARWDEAEGALRRAQDVVDLMSGTAAADDARSRFGVGKDEITRLLVKIDLRKRDFAALFEDLERGRARVFVALLAQRTIAAGREDAMTARVRALDGEIQKERQKKLSLAGGGEAQAGRESALLEQRSSLVAELRKRDPELADALSVSALGLEAARKLLPAGVGMFYVLPLESDQPIRALWITREQTELRQLGLTGAQLKMHLDAFTSAARSHDAAAQSAPLAEISRAFDFASWGRVRAAYVVPSGDTHFLPWGALNVPFPVAVLPTGGWVARTPRAGLAAARAAVVGDPAFGGLLPQLPGARAEAQAVSAQYGTPALVDEEATEAALRRRVGTGVGVLHFATHALYDSVYPLQSALILTDGKRAAALTAEKLFERPLVSRIVVLSACETGMGRVIGGDDLLGLARSFYLGGATAVMSSLWPVEDEATRSFMEIFHRESADGNYGRAWLAARDALKARGLAPSAYGAFLLGGSL